jgi:hypothetical protein
MIRMPRAISARGAGSRTEMNRRSFLTAALFTSAATIAAGCGARHREAVEPPQIQASVAQFAGADASALSMRLEMQIYNPNPYDLWAEGMNATLSVAGQQVGGARVTFAQALPAQRPLPIVANVAIPRAGLVAMAQMQAAAMGPQGATLQPGAGGTGFVSQTSGAMVPFSVAGTMELMGRRRHQRMVVPFTMNGQFPAQVILALASGAVVPPPAQPQGVPVSGGEMTGGPSTN